MNRKLFTILVAGLLLLSTKNALALPKLNDALIGNSHQQLIKKFGKNNLRSYQIIGNNETMTFNYNQGDTPGAVTFYLQENSLKEFEINDREEMAKEYLSEFASGAILFNYPKVRTALLNALMKLPLDIYLNVTDRRRPIIFIDYYTGGIAQYAGSMEFTMRQTDPPTFDDGFYIIRLGDGLNDAQDTEAIEGIVLHEIMHRHLEHLKNVEGQHPCALEKEANQKLKELGFAGEYEKASDFFGAKKKGDSPCTDILLELEQKSKEN